MSCFVSIIHRTGWPSTLCQAWVELCIILGFPSVFVATISSIYCRSIFLPEYVELFVYFCRLSPLRRQKHVHYKVFVVPAQRRTRTVATDGLMYPDSPCFFTAHYEQYRDIWGMFIAGGAHEWALRSLVKTLVRQALGLVLRQQTHASRRPRRDVSHRCLLVR